MNRQSENESTDLWCSMQPTTNVARSLSLSVSVCLSFSFPGRLNTSHSQV